VPEDQGTTGNPLESLRGSLQGSDPVAKWRQTVNKGVRLSAIRDPEGNTITFIGDFRVQY
jgi:hypothetical protein